VTPRNPYGEHDRPLHPATAWVLARLTDLEYHLLRRALRGDDSVAIGEWMSITAAGALSRLKLLIARFGLDTKRELLFDLAGCRAAPPPFVEPFADYPLTQLRGRKGRKVGLLAPKEVEALRGLYAGKTVREIAAERGIRTQPVVDQLTSACRKLGIPGGSTRSFRIVRYLLDVALLEQANQAFLVRVRPSFPGNARSV
jgi:DNA-binding CsgD family transcriptional regulator